MKSGHIAAADVYDGTSAVGESRHRIPSRIRWSTDGTSAGLAAIGLVPVRLGGSFVRRFTRPPHEKGNVGIRNCKAGRIDLRERRILKPSAKPSPQLKPVKPQRRLHERLEEPLPLRGVEPRPALHRRLKQISAHLASLNQQTKMQKQKSEIC